VVRFDEIPVPVDSKLPGDGGAVLDLIMRLGAAGRAVQMAGAARAVVSETVRYVSERKQFGRPVGSFQAVQHHLANMAAAHRAIRSLAYRAAWRLHEGEDGHLDVSRAKLTANESLPKLCWTAHQCHGAIGFTWEHNLHLFTRRALTWRTEYGDSVYHRRVIANAVIAANVG
jgi:alkylation response protein AidB-like acyl-CoA dehydrogenase